MINFLTLISRGAARSPVNPRKLVDQFDRKPLLIEADRVLPSHLVDVAALENGVLQPQPRYSPKNGFRLEVCEAPVRTEVRDDDDW